MYTQEPQYFYTQKQESKISFRQPTSPFNPKFVERGSITA